MSTDTHTTFESGAIRSSKRPRFDLIPREALLGLARRLEYGAAKYGEYNWQKGAFDADFRRDTVNHLMAHLLDYQLNGNTSEDNTGAILANAAFLEYFETMQPLQKLRESYTLKPKVRKPRG
jgi:hypothetical protein